MSNEERKVPELRFKGFHDDWEQRKLFDLADFYSGGTPSVTKKEYYEGGIPFIRSAEINNKDTKLSLSDSGLKNSSAKMVSKGDILYALYGATSGEVGISKIDGAINQAILAIKLNNLHSSLFIFNWLAKSKEKIVRKFLQGGQGNLSSSIIKNLNVKIPDNISEQNKVGRLIGVIDEIIELHQRKINTLEQQKKEFISIIFPIKGDNIPRIRFNQYKDQWEQRKLGNEFEKVNERNDGSFGREHWISVARMYFQNPDKVQSNNIKTRTYVMREGDIAFEGHPNSEFQFGRFVANDIGSGVVSELFPIYRHKQKYDNYYWKIAIQIERIMAPIFSKSITSSGNSSNKLNPEHFFRQQILVPNIEEQQKIGDFFKRLDDTLFLHQSKLEKLIKIKQIYLTKMFI